MRLMRALDRPFRLLSIALASPGPDATLNQSRGWTPAAALRLAGLFVIVIVARASVPRGVPWRPWDQEFGLAYVAAVILLHGFLFLTVSGLFTFGAPLAGDAVALAPFAVALLIREVFTLHSIDNTHIQFAHGLASPHSMLSPYLEAFLRPITADVQTAVFHFNGILGAAATLPLYGLVRQRTGSQLAAVLCASLFAVDPLLAHFSPTDGPYSLLFATWFAGLTLLSVPEPSARQLMAGLILLGLAGVCRMEGALYVAVSGLLLDPWRLLRAAWRHPLAAGLGGATTIGLISLHLVGKLGGDTHVVWHGLAPVLTEGLTKPYLGGRVLTRLMVLGALTGLADPRARVAVGALAGALMAVFPAGPSASRLMAHHLVPSRALQVVTAGVGIWATVRLLRWLRLPSWCHVVSALACVVFLGTQHAGFLREGYTFSAEYKILRRHLSGTNTPADGCTLLTPDPPQLGDAHIPIHPNYFERILPEMRITPCFGKACVEIVSKGGCYYYLRSSACFDGIPPARCNHTSPSGRAAEECLNDACAPLEREGRLEPLEVTDAALVDREAGPPEHLGLFRVTGLR
jgi:hypothetical protein